MKGIISMSTKETGRIAILEKLMNKEIKQKHAGQLLHLSVRQVRRLAKRYKRSGVAGIPHQSRGRAGNHRIDEATLNHITDIVRTTYVDFGPTLAHEKLIESHGIHLSRETLRKAMIAGNLWRSRQRKYIDLHQLRERRPCEGELVQLDGSPHDWFEGRSPKCTLLVFIDDATGKLKHLKFAVSESTDAYFTATKEYLLIHGKPLIFYLDKHGVFRVNTTKAGTAETSDSNGLTQFGRAMAELKIELIFAETAEAKGRVERVNQTLQDRLVKEMRLKRINTIEEANAYLPEFIEMFNRKFAVVPKDKANLHRPLLTTDRLDEILCEKHTRILSKQLIISYKNKQYQIRTKRPTYAMRYAPVEIREDQQGVVTIVYQEKILEYEIITLQPKAEIVDSKQLNMKVDQIKERLLTIQRSKAHRPADNHPWRNPMYYSPELFTPTV